MDLSFTGRPRGSRKKRGKYAEPDLQRFGVAANSWIALARKGSEISPQDIQIVKLLLNNMPYFTVLAPTEAPLPG